MFLSRLNGRIHQLTRHSRGQLLVAIFAVAFLGASIPNLHWHAHAGGHAVHEHSAFDGPQVDDHDHDHAGGDAVADEDNTSLHLHDSNHSMSAVGSVSLLPIDIELLPGLLASFAADSPPSSILIPPYRPPIA